ncbi:hypothetical protein D515_03022 [Grimontia indica]|uniref:Transmembrane anchor protein n=1 Tax=Grimontia indica TaxID=1056512 RepID=R1ISC5_9GAMM|nr:preprotein translocase subunit SecE [Grimontia indica]EOD78240.1 hypothetical protein D515_03022 [Grimontia indica]
MYNSDMPTRAELPTSKQLIRSTLIALVIAIFLLVTVILPAEYGIDPTGIGRVLGLKEMGDIKTQLAQEAAADKATNSLSVTSDIKEVETPAITEFQGEKPVWKDRVLLALKPGQGAEVKLMMNKGEQAIFEWKAKGGAVNFDAHGDGNGHAVSYEKGRGAIEDQGVLTAAFTGNHGWFFRNRNDHTVMVILRTSGEYAEVKRIF